MTRTFLNAPENPLAQYGRSEGAVGNGYAFATAVAIDWSTMRLDSSVSSLHNEVITCTDRIGQILDRADCTWRDVVKVTCWIADDTYRAECEAALSERINPGDCVVSFVTVGLPGEARVELDVIAL